MYGNLGVDLTRGQQRQLTQAQRRVTKLMPIVAEAPAGKRLAMRKRLTRAQEKITRLTAVLPPEVIQPTIPPPIGIPPPTGVFPPPNGGIFPPAMVTTRTGVWYDPVTDTQTMTPPATSTEILPDAGESLVGSVPNVYLFLGVIALFMLFKRRQ
jgi:hypothetical protein